MGIHLIKSRNADAGTVILEVHGEQTGRAYAVKENAARAAKRVDGSLKGCDVEHLVGQRGIALMGLFRFADDGGEIVVFQNGTVESVRRSLCGFAGKVELERGKAFEAQLFGKADDCGGRGIAGHRQLLGVHVHGVASVNEQIVRNALFGVRHAVHTGAYKQGAAHENHPLDVCSSLSYKIGGKK